MAPPEGAGYPRKSAFVLYALLLVLGIALYWVWGVIYGTWNPFTKGNIAIYVVCAPLIALGVIGMILYRDKMPKAQ